MSDPQRSPEIEKLVAAHHASVFYDELADITQTERDAIKASLTPAEMKASLEFWAAIKVDRFFFDFVVALGKKGVVSRKTFASSSFHTHPADCLADGPGADLL